MADPLHTENLIDLVAYTTVTYKKGELIIDPTDSSDFCYEILSGRVKVYAIRANGDPDIKIIYGPGELFPLTWLLGIESFNVYFEALSDCSLAKLSQSAILAAAQTDIAVSNTILQKVLHQFALYAARIDSLGYKYARERLAHRLLYLGQNSQRDPQTGTITLPPMSQQELGSVINLSRESVNRELSRFERLGGISIHNKQITILQADLLQRELRNSQA